MTPSPAVFEAFPTPVFAVAADRVCWVNRAAARLLKRERSSLVLCPVSELMSEDDLAAIRNRLVGGGGPLRLSLFAGASPITVDAQVTPAEDDVWLLTCSEAHYTSRVESLIARLSSLYVRGEGRAMVELDVLIEMSRSVFEELGWTGVIWEMKPEGALFRTSIADPSSGRVWALGQWLEGRVLPYSRVSRLLRIMKTHRGAFLDDAVAATVGLVRAVPEAPFAVDEIAESIRATGCARVAWAPSIVRDEVAFIVGVTGPNLTERDYAAVELFASQISATVQLGELSSEMAREQRLAALGQMSTLLAHEIRNPLAVMFQAHREVRKRAENGAIDPLLEILDDEAKRLEKLIDNLLHFAGPVQPKLQTVLLPQVVRWTLAGLSEASPGQPMPGVHVDIPGAASKVVADPVLLRQAFAHLLSNACAHVTQGGRVDVQARIVPDGRVRLRVRNDSEPLSEEVALRAFEPFFTTRAAGSGLGLAVVRRLVEDQAGTVTLDRDAQGVSFSIWLRTPSLLTSSPQSGYLR